MGNLDEDDEAVGMAPGTVIDGRYKVVRTLGHGGNGLVHEVEHTRSGRRLALKTLLDESGAARLEQEARATSLLKNAHAAKITDVGVDDPVGPYLVMELLEGQSLRALLDEAGQLPLELTASIALQVCECLTEAHSIGIIHRDLKPENVYLCSSPWPGEHDVKVLDFGVVKIAGDGGPIPNSSLTRTGSTVGTPYYMSLEQLRNSSAVDARADVYSLGVVLYESLSGRKPFQADTIGDLVYALCSGPPTHLSRLRPDLPTDVAELVMRTLAVNRDDRPATMVELALGLLPHGLSAFGLWVRVDGKQPALAPRESASKPAPAPAAPNKRPPAQAPAPLPPRPGTTTEPSFGTSKLQVSDEPSLTAPLGLGAAPAAPVWGGPNTRQRWPESPVQVEAPSTSGQRDTPTEMYAKDAHGAPVVKGAPAASGDRDTPTKAFRTDEIKLPAGLYLEPISGDVASHDATPPPTFGVHPGPAPVLSFGAPSLPQGPVPVTGGTLRLNEAAGGQQAMMQQPQTLAPGSKPAWQTSLDAVFVGIGRFGEDLVKRFKESPPNMQIAVIAGVGLTGLLFLVLLLVLIFKS